MDVVLVPAALDVFDHQRGLADLSVTDHANLDNYTSILLGLLSLSILFAVVAVFAAQARAGAGGILVHLIFRVLRLGGVVL